MQNRNDNKIRLFEGERWLIYTGVLGFILALGIGVYILSHEAIILPEGNLERAFSFNAAIGVFLLSIAAIMPLAQFTGRKRRNIRWTLIIVTLYSYAIETIQHFRGVNPRFTKEGSILDIVLGGLFGVASLILVAIMLVFTVHFLRIKPPHSRPLILLGIRYAFLSVLVANLAGIWMIAIQSRFTGDTGNLIIVHGIAYHALQTLLLPAWFLERSNIHARVKKNIHHIGSNAWLLMVLIISVQTALGRSVFEWSILPIVAGCLLLIWVITMATSFIIFLVTILNITNNADNKKISDM
ncbi:hypothetical protein SH601_02690 [Gracilibacillus sp. S3-1-1]|uniref:Uncharacterized protein n=1 Tax=Gracilibacillus pellucidus TaxID=3095368 RepID=A0ACC6M1T4_9BACI|nr:hypothetical protein [Gracilibacillus sp. S3-1-1]MDX8044883.1 hypothetical protein [Gracilibacillus sp. S3-1-1]